MALATGRLGAASGPERAEPGGPVVAARREKDPKRVYYLSMEFLMGRSLLNTVYNLDIKDNFTEALTELGCAPRRGRGLPSVPCRSRLRLFLAGPHHAPQCGKRSRPARDPLPACWSQVRPGDACRAGARRGTGQWRPGPPGRVLPGLDGHAGPARLGLRHPLPVRHVPPGEAGAARRSGGAGVAQAVWSGRSPRLDRF
jgi:hypothetical protein